MTVKENASLKLSVLFPMILIAYNFQGFRRNFHTPFCTPLNFYFIPCRNLEPMSSNTNSNTLFEGSARTLTFDSDERVDYKLD